MFQAGSAFLPRAGYGSRGAAALDAPAAAGPHVESVELSPDPSHRLEPEPTGSSRKAALRDYTGQCLVRTALSFTLPTAAACALAPSARWVCVFASGAVFGAQREMPLRTVVKPSPDREAMRVANTLSFAPFLVTFGLQAAFTERASNPKSVEARIAGKWAAKFEQACELLPSAVARSAAKYPANFVTARILAQLGAGLAGSAASNVYLESAVGGERRLAPPQSKAAAPFNPAAPIVSAVFFAIPAALATPSGAQLLARYIPNPVGRALAQTGVFIVTALGADEAIHLMRSDNASPGSDAGAQA